MIVEKPAIINKIIDIAKYENSPREDVTFPFDIHHPAK
jgi:hypothetical protein